MTEEDLPVQIGEVWECSFDSNFVYIVTTICEEMSPDGDYDVKGLRLFNVGTSVEIDSVRKPVMNNGIYEYSYIGEIEKLKIDNKLVKMGVNDG